MTGNFNTIILPSVVFIFTKSIPTPQPHPHPPPPPKKKKKNQEYHECQTFQVIDDTRHMAANVISKSI